jgi:putative phosphoesterase
MGDDLNNILVGVISDTHGLLRPEAVASLRGVELIIHAGDIGRREVIEELQLIAPTYAIRGNIDTEAWANAFPATRVVEAGDCRCFVVHNIADLDLMPAAAGFAAVIYGHSHRPVIETRDGVVFLNPGSAGPRRFRLPVTLARMRISGGVVRPEIIDLDV